MTMKKIFFALLATYCIVNQTIAQDSHFTQFYASPLTLNPALTGAFSGKYRVSMVYRDQWRNVSPVPLQTATGAIDLRFELDQKRTSKDVVNVGMVFVNDKTSVFNFNTNQLMLSAGFTKALTNDNTQFLTAAIQGGVGQKNLNFDNLNFSDEFDGTSKYNINSNEIGRFPLNNFSYGDLATGLNYVIAPRRGVNYHIGVAVHHLTQPSISFFEAEKGGTATLKRKYVAYVNAAIPVNSRTQISPRLLFQAQGRHAELNVGANFRLQFNDYGTTAMHVGGWARSVRNAPTKVGFDSAVALVGFEFNNFLLGFSYDLNIRSVGTFKQGQSAMEISLGYLGDYDNDAILCPKF
jgi:type IX secretion system PorP/SprF family membrane protein